MSSEKKTEFLKTQLFLKRERAEFPLFVVVVLIVNQYLEERAEFILNWEKE